MKSNILESVSREKTEYIISSLKLDNFYALLFAKLIGQKTL